MGAGVAGGVLAAGLATLVCLCLARRTATAAGKRGRGDPVSVRVAAPLLPLLVAFACLVPWAPWSALATGCVVLWLLTLPWLPLTRRWDMWAHAAWALTVAAGAFYVVAMAAWTVGSGLGWTGMAGAWALWLLEVMAWLLLLAYGWEIFDVLGSRHWVRRLAPMAAVLRADVEAPFVSIHVPSHNEPPELVIQTLESLRHLDYPHFEVLVLDNNTDDEGLWLPVARHCAAHPSVLKFHRLTGWPGYKAGALNYAEDQADPRATLVAVVDADYQVEPGWLRDTVGAFDDPRVGFVQTPQDYRDWNHSAYLRHLYYSYDYFFSVSQPSRDERDGAIFGGTMGLVRRSALRDVGRWDEWCVTEDAELSLRLLEAGWVGHHLDHSYGHGIMPLTFESLKRQRFRWCFGGMQILRRHWRALLPWSQATRLTLGQRLAYLSGGLQWFGDLLGLMFAIVVVASLLDLAFGDGLVLRRLTGLLIVAVPALIALGVVRAVAAVKTVGRGVSWGDAVGVFSIWLSLGWVVSVACVRGLVEPEGVFVRTPKARISGLRWVDALRTHRAEMLLAAAAVGAVVTALVRTPSTVTVVLSAMLVVPVAGWLAAPVHSVAALRADLPDLLRRRRSAERTRGWWRPGARSVPVLSALGAAALAGLLVLVIQPGSGDVPRGPAGSLAAPRSDHPAPATTPGTSTTTAATSTTSATTSSTSQAPATSSLAPAPVTTAPPGSSSSSTTSPPRPTTVSPPSPTRTNSGRSPTTKPH